MADFGSFMTFSTRKNVTYSIGVALIMCSLCVQLYVGPTDMGLIFGDKFQVGMKFRMNGLDYHRVGPTIEFRACVCLCEERKID